MLAAALSLLLLSAHKVHLTYSLALPDSLRTTTQQVPMRLAPSWNLPSSVKLDLSAPLQSDTAKDHILDHDPHAKIAWAIAATNLRTPYMNISTHGNTKHLHTVRLIFGYRGHTITKLRHDAYYGAAKTTGLITLETRWKLEDEQDVESGLHFLFACSLIVSGLILSSTLRIAVDEESMARKERAAAQDSGPRERMTLQGEDAFRHSSVDSSSTTIRRTKRREEIR